MRRALGAGSCRGVRRSFPMPTRDDILTELGLVPTWRLRTRAAAGGVARRSSRRAEPESPPVRASADGDGAMPNRAPPASPGSNGATSPPTSMPASPAASRAAGRSRCPASATSTPSGCSSARRRAAKRTRRASPSSGRPASFSTTCWRRSGMKRGENVYIANVLKCRPPSNRTPEPREIDACRPYLDRQIALIRPQADRRAGQERGDDAARRRRDDREPARTRPPVPRRAARRHLPSGLPAAQLARQGEGVGGSAVCAAHAARRGRSPTRRRRAGP